MTREGMSTERGESGGFSGPEVCKLAGCTYRQLDYWDWTGLLKPSIAAAHGSGSRRRYAAADVLGCRLIVMLTRAAGTRTGAPIPDHAWRMARVVEGWANPPADRFLIDDGETARIVGERELRRLAVESAHVLTVVKVSDLVPPVERTGPAQVAKSGERISRARRS